MPRTLYTAAALADLEEAWVSIGEHDPAAADRLLDRISDVARLYAQQPELGQQAERYRPGLRYFVVRPYVIFYDQHGQGIRVYRVLHGARNIEEILRA